MRQLRVELTRLRWRRAVVVLLLLALAIPALIGASRIWSTRPVSEAEIAQLVRTNAEELQRCVERPRQFGLPRSADEQQCTDRIVEWYAGRSPLRLAEEQVGSGLGVVAVLTMLLMLLGTTFAGHDWATGSMSNQLLFEARRGRVWSAKAAAVTLVSLVTATVVSTAYWLVLYGVARLRDLPLREDALLDSLAYGLRGAGFAAAAALGGYALTMLFRSTVATIGVLFAVTVAGGIVLAALDVSDRWQPAANLAAIVNNGTTYWVPVPESCWSGGEEPQPGSECDPEAHLSLGHGVGYYGTALVLVGAASVLTFRRRDVP